MCRPTQSPLLLGRWEPSSYWSLSFFFAPIFLRDCYRPLLHYQGPQLHSRTVDSDLEVLFLTVKFLQVFQSEQTISFAHTDCLLNKTSLKYLLSFTDKKFADLCFISPCGLRTIYYHKEAPLCYSLIMALTPSPLSLATTDLFFTSTAYNPVFFHLRITYYEILAHKLFNKY